jgi:hypothetical protein
MRRGQSIKKILYHSCTVANQLLRDESSRWYMAGAFMLSAMLLMLSDSWYKGPDSNVQIAITSLFITYLTLTTLFYDARYFGKPKGMNLFMQLLMFFPFSVFVQRLFGTPASASVEHKASILKQMLAIGRQAFDFVIGVDFIPLFIREIISTPSLALTLLVLITGTAISRRRHIKVGWILLAYIIPLFSVINQNPSLWWILGAISLFIALAIMFHDVDTHSGDYFIIKRLRHVDDQLEYKASIRICKEAFSQGAITPEQIIMICKDIYRDSQGIGYEEIAHSLCLRLVTEHRLLSSEARSFVPAPTGALTATDFGNILLFPRDAIVFLIALLWYLCPIDLISDVIPVGGCADDMFLLWLGGSQMKKYFMPDRLR